MLHDAMGVYMLMSDYFCADFTVSTAQKVGVPCLDPSRMSLLLPAQSDMQTVGVRTQLRGQLLPVNVGTDTNSVCPFFYVSYLVYFLP